MRRACSGALLAALIGLGCAPPPTGVAPAPLVVAAPPAIAVAPERTATPTPPEPSGPRPAHHAALLGWWSETWGVEEQTDVDYHDVYQITFDGQLIVWCPDRPYYRFDEVDFDGEHLDVRLVNPRDPADIYVVDYELDLAAGGERLVGQAKTNKRETPVQIEWVKLQR